MEVDEISENRLLYTVNTVMREINHANDIAAIDDLDIQIVVAKYKTVNTLKNADRDNLANGILKHLLVQNFNKM